MWIAPERGLLYTLANHRAASSMAARSTVPVCHTNPKYSRVPRGPVYDAGNGPSGAFPHAEQPGVVPLGTAGGALVGRTIVPWR